MPQRHSTLVVVLCSALTAATGAGAPLPAQQVADTAFRPLVGAPAYPPGSGPVVLLDEAHVNFHTAGGRYLPFARLLEGDGFVVRPNRAAFDRSTLDSAQVLVIANALSPQNAEDWFLPTPSAFTAAEIAAVRDWVAVGGSLLLIADHMPFPGAAADLAAALGVLMLNGFAYDSALENSQFVYRRADGSLGDHPVTRGRRPTERVDSVVVFTGQAFRFAPGNSGTQLFTLAAGTVVLLPEEAWQFSRRTPRLAGGGFLQGALLQHGRGRVAVFGEAAMFSAQVAGPQRSPMGMNAPRAAQNAQFALNVMHWLSGILE